MNYGIINLETNECVNVVVLEEGSTWTPPEGHLITPLQENAGIGWTYASGVWTEPPQPEESAE